ncbi:MAG: hypothetical protein H6563_02390 [Lewinellaceae bacterium]|nr:hypothetical protein [Lewinellaceae bacterium]
MDKPTIQNWIQQNELKQAIEDLISHARSEGLRDWERELIDLSRRYRENGDLHRRNLITSEVWSVNETRIASALLEILDHVEEGTPGPTQKERQAMQEALPEAPRTKFRTFAGIALALTEVAALLGVFVFWDLGSLTNPAFGVVAGMVLVLPLAAGYVALKRMPGGKGVNVTPLQIFLFLLTLLTYLAGVYFFLLMKSVGGLFGEAFWPMEVAIGVWCLIFGVTAGYWVRKIFLSEL